MSKSVTKICPLPHKVTVSSLLTTGIVGSETCSLTLKNDSIMRSTFSILYYINRSKVKTDGTTAIMCRINIDGKNSVFATGCYCNPKDWKAKTGEVAGAYP